MRDQRQAGAGRALPPARRWGFELVATRGTARRSCEARACRSASSTRCAKAGPHIVDGCCSGGIQLVFNTTEGAQAIADSFSLRRTALTHNIPYYTTVAGARAAVQAIGALRAGSLEVAPLQSYFDCYAAASAFSTFDTGCKRWSR